VTGERTPAASAAGDVVAGFADVVPAPVVDLLETLWRRGHAAYVVGGALRDVLAGRSSADWDLATSARPEVTAAVFPDAAYENAFGTVAVRRDGATYEITTFRSDHDYADFRRPHHVEFGTSLELDLARRDFTMNALAWGAEAGDPPALVDPFGGLADIQARRIRAVGEPRARFEEDALRIVRAIRFATILGWEIDPETMAAIHLTADLVRHLSGERIAEELGKILSAERPSIGLRLLQETGALGAISEDLAAQVGVAQNKIAGEDLWDHTVRTADAVPADLTNVRWAALVHDIGKPSTAADGHFYNHDSVGAELAGAFLDALHLPTLMQKRIVHLVRQHMFRYEPSWGDAAVRRFLAKVGPAAIDELLALREADNDGSGVARNADDLDELRARIAAEIASGPILDRTALAVDGTDLMSELELPAGPVLGAIIEALFEKVVEDPRLNARAMLLDLARGIRAELEATE
jgi:putative nucleotidyltransferase with HDIG domain